MLKRNLLTLLTLLALVLSLAACDANLDQAVQDASATAEAVATANADQINAGAATVEAAATANADQINAGAATVEAAATANADQVNEAIASTGIDPAIYGNIADIDLNGVTVTFWHQHTGARGEELAAIVDEFNATNPYGIIVVATNEGEYSDIYDKMIAGLTTGNVPSLVVAYQNQAAAYQVAEGLVSIDPYINDPIFGLSEEDKADFFQSFLDSDRLPQFGDQAFGFPPNRSMEVLYYNMDWLTELGYDGPPQTPEEFGEMACAATDADAGTVGYEISTDASRFASFVFARGGDIYDYENNQFTLNNQAAVDAMTQMQQLYADGCAILIAERNGDQADFAARKTLFTIGSSSGLPFYRNAIETSEQGTFAWSVAPIPYTGATPSQNIYGASVSIPKTTPQQQLGAWLFLKYYTSPEIQARWAMASNYFPVRASVADGLADYFAKEPAFGVAFDLLQYGKTEAPVAGYDNARDEIAEAYSRILNGEDVQTVLDELNTKANQILAESAP